MKRLNSLITGILAGNLIFLGCNNEGELGGTIVGRAPIKGKRGNHQVGTTYVIAGKNGRTYVIEKGICEDSFNVEDEVTLKLKGAHAYEMYKK